MLLGAFYLALSIESSFIAFSLYFTFFVSNKIKVTYCGLEGVFLSRSIPVKTGIPSAFGGRAGFYVGISHTFAQGMLAAIILVGGGY